MNNESILTTSAKRCTPTGQSVDSAGTNVGFANGAFGSRSSGCQQLFEQVSRDVLQVWPIPKSETAASEYEGMTMRTEGAPKNADERRNVAVGLLVDLATTTNRPDDVSKWQLLPVKALETNSRN